MDGSRSKPAGHGLDWFNAAPDADLRAALSACCAADSWVARVGGGRPYPDEDGLYAASDAATAALDDAGLGQALAAHPRIGERAAGHKGAWSRQEQVGVAGAGDALRGQLAAANAAYEQRFRHVYLVCATGRSAAELLAVCRSRLGNDPASERRVVLGDPGAGVHRITFDTGGYFAGRGVTTFYPEVIVAFDITDPAAHLHVPLLLSPFAFSTYRGS